MRNLLFTSESVTEGHPDKICDQIADAILDNIIAQDKKARVACETMVKSGLVFVAGEITTDCYVDISDIVRTIIKDIGYDDGAIGFDYKSCGIIVAIEKQSPDISQGVTEGEGLYKEQGAGDQGMMMGFACNETKELMPFSILYAHKLAKRLAEARKSGEIKFLRPDGKSQVTVEYEGDRVKRVDTVVISTQHTEDVSYDELRETIIEKVILKTIPLKYVDEKTRYFINPTGRFVIGGPLGDTGLTGRKIVVDTYGGHGGHGGGSFSGKDPSKVDRSASYMMRYIAKNIVAAGLASKCLIQISYAIGVADPISIMVDTYGTGVVPEEKLVEAIREIFPLKPASIITHLDLLRPIYTKTAVYGHFGREEPEFTWEKVDKVEELKSFFKG